MSKLYEYAVLYHPKPKKDAEGNEVREKSSLIVAVETVMADSDQEATIVAARKIPESYLDKLEQVEIVIRPF